jgi:hypothetical protein
MAIMILLICGDRLWPDYQTVWREVARLPVKPEKIVVGDAMGADACGLRVAKEMKIPYIIYYANWAKYGRAAGPIRNQEVLEALIDFRKQGTEVFALAFHRDFDRSRGTKDMVKRLIKAGIPYRLVKN